MIFFHSWKHTQNKFLNNCDTDTSKNNVTFHLMTQHYREAYLVSDWSQVTAPKNSKQHNDHSTREKKSARRFECAKSQRAKVCIFLCLLNLFQAALLWFCFPVVWSWCGVEHRSRGNTRITEPSHQLQTDSLWSRGSQGKSWSACSWGFQGTVGDRHCITYVTQRNVM